MRSSRRIEQNVNPLIAREEKEPIQAAYNSGVVLVIAAGNSNSSAPFHPAAYNNSVIAVSALNPKNRKSSYSNYGSYIELAAPGEHICSSFPVGRYNCGSGTSFAVPFVSAFVALMLSKNGTMTPSEVRNMLNSKAIDLEVPGWDQYYGYGLVNACPAVSSDCPKAPGWTNGYSITPLPLVPWMTLLPATLALLAVRRKSLQGSSG